MPGKTYDKSAFVQAGVMVDPHTGRAVAYVLFGRHGFSQWYATEGEAHTGLESELRRLGF